MQVLPFKIPKSDRSSIVFQDDRDKIPYDNLHQHLEYQITLVESGSGKLICGDSISTFNAGEIYLFGSHLPHLFKSDSICSMVSVFFTHSCLGDSFFELTELHDIKLMLDNTGRGIQILNLTVRIKELIYACEKNHGQHNVISFLQLLSAINDSQKRMLSQQSYDLQLSADEGERMNLVYRYAMDNYQNDIKLEDVAFVAMLSKNAFCKYFKKRTRKTFFQFLIELRIEKACELLMTEKFPINEIGHIIGFKNQSNFNRQFKKLKQTSPSEYRRTFLNSKSY